MTTHVQDALDTSYIPSEELYESSKSVTTESEQSDNDKVEELERYSSNDPIIDSKATVFKPCLLPLLRICQICFFRGKITKFMSRGSNLIVKQKCSKDHISQWRFQPKIKRWYVSRKFIALIGNIIYREYIHQD